LEKEDGSMESMVQRVVRQVHEAKLTEDITFATNESQLDIITNQLGDSVSVVTEPERRDTFPAIALAVSYLKITKGCSEDEVVVIMPCDPYTEAGYFHTIRKMIECVEANVADLVLMGITPTCPSTKYGYIIPEKDLLGMCSTKEYRYVSYFTEKPSVGLAKELLKHGALWNGGVFAFRLGYMMNIIKRYITSESFDDIRNRYQEFPKISFDYEVAEKAQSIAVVPFTGQWKDLGTWNSLTDELHKPIIGNAVMGEHCENTHVINELQHFIYVDGLKDIVVAACPDGILVCSKEHSEKIKKAVENLTLCSIYKECCWGTYRVLDNSIYPDGSYSLTKSINLNPGKSISYQIHHYCSEVWTFVQGEGVFLLEGVEQRVKAGDTVFIPVEHFHAIKAITPLTFIKVQSGNLLVEEDIEWEWSE
jgi:mannose-6-phosphate isomerase